MADSLAKFGCSQVEYFIVFSQPLPIVLEALLSDCNSVPTPRSIRASPLALFNRLSCYHKKKKDPFFLNFRMSFFFPGYKFKYSTITIGDRSEIEVLI